MKATIQIIVTDQGNGGAYCSDCGHCLDGGDPTKTLPDKCPKCKVAFKDREDPWLSPGGSDFDE